MPDPHPQHFILHRQFADPLLFNQFLQSLDRKANINVEIGVVVRILELMNDQILMLLRMKARDES